MVEKDVFAETVGNEIETEADGIGNGKAIKEVVEKVIVTEIGIVNVDVGTVVEIVNVEIEKKTISINTERTTVVTVTATNGLSKKAVVLEVSEVKAEKIKNVYFEVVDVVAVDDGVDNKRIS